jgi:hypothetical protein
MNELLVHLLGTRDPARPSILRLHRLPGDGFFLTQGDAPRGRYAFLRAYCHKRGFVSTARMRLWSDPDRSILAVG